MKLLAYVQTNKQQSRACKLLFVYACTYIHTYIDTRPKVSMLCSCLLLLATDTIVQLDSNHCPHPIHTPQCPPNFTCPSIILTLILAPSHPHPLTLHPSHSNTLPPSNLHDLVCTLQDTSVLHVMQTGATESPWTSHAAQESAPLVVLFCLCSFVSDSPSPPSPHRVPSLDKCRPSPSCPAPCPGVATVVGCVVVLYFNIGIPNELRGFFLFAQVSTAVM